MMKDKTSWRIVCCVAWLFAAIGAINWGLVAMNVDLFGMVPFLNTIRVPFLYVVGLSGVISLIGWVKHLMNGCAC